MPDLKSEAATSDFASVPKMLGPINQGRIVSSVSASCTRKTSAASWRVGRRGGTLIRFAGPRLTAALPTINCPVAVAKEETEPGRRALLESNRNRLADYPATGPFCRIGPPRDMTVGAVSVLAEPFGDMPHHLRKLDDGHSHGHRR